MRKLDASIAMMLKMNKKLYTLGDINNKFTTLENKYVNLESRVTKVEKKSEALTAFEVKYTEQQ